MTERALKYRFGSRAGVYDRMSTDRSASHTGLSQL
jgi:hypothetical protein